MFNTMTPEEIQRTIEGMLAVQRELQNSQLKLQEESQRQREDINALREDIGTLVQGIGQLIEVSNRHERRIEQLICYSITSESDRLDLQQEVNDLKRRVERLENQNN
jgi:chromosome segregation ATPase